MASRLNGAHLLWATVALTLATLAAGVLLSHHETEEVRKAAGLLLLGPLAITCAALCCSAVLVFVRFTSSLKWEAD